MPAAETIGPAPRSDEAIVAAVISARAHLIQDKTYSRWSTEPGQGIRECAMASPVTKCDKLANFAFEPCQGSGAPPGRTPRSRDRRGLRGWNSDAVVGDRSAQFLGEPYEFLCAGADALDAGAGGVG